MKSGSSLATLGAFVSGIDMNCLPADVVEKATLCLADGLAGPMAAALSGRNRAAIDALTTDPETSGPATVLGVDRTSSAETAAFLNAATAASAISNDTHLASATHPGMVIVPVALAVAQSVGSRGEDLIAAIVAGYEIMIRTGRVLVTPELSRRFRPTGLAGPLGAAAAAARLLGLDAGQAAHAIALAAHTAAGLNEWANAGTDEHVFHAARAARDGIIAAKLARGGVRAAQTTLDGPAGLLAAFDATPRAAHLLAGLGTAFAILEVVYKAVPACVFVQVPCILAAELVRMPAFDPSAIEAIEIAVSQQAAAFPGCDNPGPVFTRAAAEQSHQFSVAAVLANGFIRDEDWSQPNAAGADRLAAIGRVMADDTAAGVTGTGARLTLHMRDGRIATASAPSFAGMTPEAVMARFIETASRLYGDAVGRRMLDTLAGIGNDRAVQRLGALLSEPCTAA